jgi:hypothetical protein
MRVERSAVVVTTAGAILLDLVRAAAILGSVGWALSRLAGG